MKINEKSTGLLVMIIISILIIILGSSCGTNKLTQEQVKINYELDKLWIKYKYESDSLINEFYKKN